MVAEIPGFGLFRRTGTGRAAAVGVEAVEQAVAVVIDIIVANFIRDAAVGAYDARFAVEISQVEKRSRRCRRAGKFLNIDRFEDR